MCDTRRITGISFDGVVAVLGLGGLGHLGVQFAAKMGFKVAVIARGKDKERLAAELGASTFIDSQSQDPGLALQQLGGASVIISTVTVGAAITQVQAGLAGNGTLMLLGVAESLQVSPTLLFLGRRSVRGWYCGASIES